MVGLVGTAAVVETSTALDWFSQITIILVAFITVGIPTLWQTRKLRMENKQQHSEVQGTLDERMDRFEAQFLKMERHQLEENAQLAAIHEELKEHRSSINGVGMRLNTHIEDHLHGVFADKNLSKRRPKEDK